MALVEIKVILDFMCPWSFIGLRSMQLARERFASQLNFAVEFVPFEYDAPGKYPSDAWHISAVKISHAKTNLLMCSKPRAYNAYILVYIYILYYLYIC